MPGDMQDKTEPPTPRRRSEARDQGQIARSADLTSALLLLGGMICMRMFAPSMIASLTEVMQEYLYVGHPADAAGQDIVLAISSVGMFTISAVGPILMGIVLIALLASLMQTGLLFTLKPLRPKMDKLNPLNGIKRLFGTRTIVQFFMNLLKLGVVCSVAYAAISSRVDDIFLAMGLGGWPQLVLMAEVLFEVGVWLAAVLLLLALLDYAWQRHKHEKGLKMSKQEVKEEMRRMEGDPIVKNRRRKMQFAAAIQRIRSAMPSADVVVTNPTEFAVAIKYNAGTMQAPKVVAKGQNLLAKLIRDLAVENGIPIVERPVLARTLFKLVEVGQEVPERFYKAIAEILAYVYELSGRSPGTRPAAA